MDLYILRITAVPGTRGPLGPVLWRLGHTLLQLAVVAKQVSLPFDVISSSLSILPSPACFSFTKHLLTAFYVLDVENENKVGTLCSWWPYRPEASGEKVTECGDDCQETTPAERGSPQPGLRSPCFKMSRVILPANKIKKQTWRVF